jgi:hypothetical protein
VKDASVWAAAIGAGLGAINTIPGVGQAVAAGAVLPEIAYLTRLQVNVAIQIALVYQTSDDV